MRMGLSTRWPSLPNKSTAGSNCFGRHAFSVSCSMAPFSLGWKFSIQHTLQISGGSSQFHEDCLDVIQVVTPTLQKRSQPRCLLGAGHAAASLDGVPDAADLVNITAGYSLFQYKVSFVEVSDHCRI